MLSRCSVSLDDDDNDEDIQVLRLYLSGDDRHWNAIYDIHTYEYLTYITKQRMDFRNHDLLETMKHSLQFICEHDALEIFSSVEEAFEDWEEEEEYKQFCQWLNVASEESYEPTPFSDEFTKMRSLLHERFSSCS